MWWLGLSSVGLLALGWYFWRTHKTGAARVVDQIVRGDGRTHEIKILSCRPKLDWHPYITIRYRGEFYQMFRKEVEATLRPFVYYLRKPPVGHLVVVICDYNPTDVVRS